MMARLELVAYVSDNQRHRVSDELVIGVGQMIGQMTRGCDIVRRLGDEELTIVLPEAGPAEACCVAERLCEAVKVSSFEVATSRTPVRATMSVGVACYALGAAALTDLIDGAIVAANPLG